MMTPILAASRIVGLLAILLLTVSAVSCAVVPPTCMMSDWKRATEGTFEINSFAALPGVPVRSNAAAAPKNVRSGI